MVADCDRDGTSLGNKGTQAKTCKYNSEIRCFWNLSCDYIDFRGDVRVCGHHPNKWGIVTRRRVSPSVLRSAHL